MRAPTKLPQLGVRKSLKRGSLLRQPCASHCAIMVLTVWNKIVKAKVVLGEIFGKTAKEESPIRPRVALASASGSLRRPKDDAPTMISLRYDTSQTKQTEKQYSISERIQRPYVGRPIGVTQAS